MSSDNPELSPRLKALLDQADAFMAEKTHPDYVDDLRAVAKTLESWLSVFPVSDQPEDLKTGLTKTRRGLDVIEQIAPFELANRAGLLDEDDEDWWQIVRLLSGLT
jgi:hypothetical protein